MARKNANWLIFCFLATTLACQKDEHQERRELVTTSDTNETLNIYKGDPVRGQYPNVGMTILIVDEEPKSICTATLICPNVLLTAAHCMRGNQNATLGFTNKGNAAMTKAQTLKLPRFRLAWAGDRGDMQKLKNDIALFVSDKPYGTFIGADQFVPLDTEGPKGIRRGDEVLAIGYGQNTAIRRNEADCPNTTGFTECKREATLVYRQYLESDDGDSKNHTYAVGPSAKGAAIDSGDSGGPLFLKGRQLAVLSAQHVYPIVGIGPEINPEAYYVPLFLHAAKIQEIKSAKCLAAPVSIVPKESLTCSAIQVGGTARVASDDPKVTATFTEKRFPGGVDRRTYRVTAKFESHLPVRIDLTNSFRIGIGRNESPKDFTWKVSEWLGQKLPAGTVGTLYIQIHNDEVLSLDEQKELTECYTTIASAKAPSTATPRPTPVIQTTTPTPTILSPVPTTQRNRQ